MRQESPYRATPHKIDVLAIKNMCATFARPLAVGHNPQMPTATNDSRPGKDLAQITQVGLKAYLLALQYAADLTGRLEAKLVTDLNDDLTSLGVVVPAVKNAHAAAHATAVAQADALGAGHDLVTATRALVSRRKADESVRKAYGVGSPVHANVVKDVSAGLRVILDRAAAQPAEAASLGILQKDLDAMKAHLATIQAADMAHENAKAAAPQTTKLRNATARRILAAVGVISGAGVLAFATSETERAAFDALVRKQG